MTDRSRFYQILGVSRDASSEEIRSAYRRLAKRFHPDVAESAGPDRFHELRGAYEVLSDPKRRRAYDLGAREGRVVVAEASPSPSASRSKTRVHRSLVEITLSPEEAARGGDLRFDVEVETPCTSCAGAGDGFFGWCADCRGIGRRVALQSVRFRIPRGVAHGATVSAYAGELGYVTGRIVVALRIRP